MKSFRDLIEEAGTIILRAAVATPTKAQEDPTFVTLLGSIQGLRDNVELAALTNDEIRHLKTFLGVVILAASMSPDAARAHIRAAYTALTKQGLLKVGVGATIRNAIQSFLNGDGPTV